MEKHSQSQQERLNYLEFKALFTGQISRNDLMQRFGISEAAATRDFAIYREEAAGNIELDNATKLYRITDVFSMRYLKGTDAKSMLRALVHGVGDDFGVDPMPVVPCELPARLHAPDITALAIVSRAIFGNHVLEVDYLSTSGGQGTREIVPFSFAGNGLRWHVRAYDRRKNRFSDFVINRLKSAKILTGGKSEPHELKEKDDDWNRMVNLEIVAHPAYKHGTLVEAEYGMIDGVLHHKARAAMVGYILRLWNVDCSRNHHIKDESCVLWLRNSIVLYGIQNAQIAPGIDKDQKTASL